MFFWEPKHFFQIAMFRLKDSSSFAELVVSFLSISKQRKKSLFKIRYKKILFIYATTFLIKIENPDWVEDFHLHLGKQSSRTCLLYDYLLHDDSLLSLSVISL